MSDESAVPLNSPWPFEEQIRLLFSLGESELQAIEGRDRLGALAFESAPGKIKRIRSILDDLQREDVADFEPSFVDSVTNHTNETVRVINEMQALSANEPNVQDNKARLDTELDNFYQWFLREVRPRAIKGELQRQIAGLTAGEGSAQDAALQLRAELARLSDDQRTLAASLAENAGVIEALRETTAQTGVSELSSYYAAQATEHNDSWKTWGKRLVAAIGVTVLGATLLFVFNHPDENASNATIARAVVFDVVILGLLLYGVRLASLQFRVHRHLEAVARSKAAALSTFNRIVQVSPEWEVRTALATVLAQAVFAVDESGFIDASADHVTLIERIAAPVAQRITPTS